MFTAQLRVEGRVMRKPVLREFLSLASVVDVWTAQKYLTCIGSHQHIFFLMIYLQGMERHVLLTPNLTTFG